LAKIAADAVAYPRRNLQLVGDTAVIGQLKRHVLLSTASPWFTRMPSLDILSKSDCQSPIRDGTLKPLPVGLVICNRLWGV
jgi:hypothetical protein